MSQGTVYLSKATLLHSLQQVVLYTFYCLLNIFTHTYIHIDFIC